MSYCARCEERDKDVADLAAEVEQLRAALIEIHKIAWDHREWAITGRCVSALGPGVPDVSAPDRSATSGVSDE